MLLPLKPITLNASDSITTAKQLAESVDGMESEVVITKDNKVMRLFWSGDLEDLYFLRDPAYTVKGTNHSAIVDLFKKQGTITLEVSYDLENKEFCLISFK